MGFRSHGSCTERGTEQSGSAGSGVSLGAQTIGYGLSVASVAAAVALRLALSEYLVDSVTYITFYPAVMIAATLGGFGPGFVATLLSAVVVDYWLLAPLGTLAISGTGDLIGLILFVLMGVFMTVVAGLYRSSRDKATALEMELAASLVNKRMGLLSDTASQLLQTNDPQGLIQSLCERVMSELDCHAFFNYLVEDEHARLHLHAYSGIPEEVAKTMEYVDFGSAVCGCSARDACTIVAEDIVNTPDQRTELVSSLGIQAYVCHPLLSEGNRVIGTLSFGSRSKARFADDELALIGAVAGQVATAMERMRMLDIQRRRAEELQAIMDVVPIAVWVGHDPKCRDITGNLRANEFYEAEPGENVSASITPVRRFFQNGRELTPEELPMQYAAANNVDVKDAEFDVETPSGKHRVLWGYATPLRHGDGQVRGVVGAFVDVTEQRELEAHKREFYQRTIFAATEGRLLISERSEIDSIAGDECASWNVNSVEDVATVRDSVRLIAADSGMADDRTQEFLGCVVEAAGNAVKHTSAGKARLCRTPESLVFVVSDSGPGIGTMSLPDVALTRGYSTVGTLGMGYKLMIKFADRVYLATDSEGTTVAIEMQLGTAPNSAKPGLPERITAWTI